jgi:hypothetical protein
MELTRISDVSTVNRPHFANYRFFVQGDTRQRAFWEVILEPPGGDFQGIGVFRSDWGSKAAQETDSRAAYHRLDEPTRLCLGMAACIRRWRISFTDYLIVLRKCGIRPPVKYAF